VLNEIFYRKGDSGRITYFNPTDVDTRIDDNGNRIGAALRSDGAPVESGGIGTMSKSKNNGVDPQELIDHYGADIARFFMMFTSPPEQTLEWLDSGVEGAARFLRRLWAFVFDRRPWIEEESKRRGGAMVYEYAGDLPKIAPLLAAARRDIHANLKQANYDLHRFQFNTVASAAMKILNTLGDLPQNHDAPPTSPHAISYQQLLHEGTNILLRLLSPITPHVSHHLWRELGFGADILAASWPEPAEEALKQEEIELVLQIGGRTRGSIRVPSDASRSVIESLAVANPVAMKYIAGRPVKKVVVVPGRLVNVVV